MKKIIVLLALASLTFSCKDETKEKVKEASKAVATDLKEAADSTATKAKKNNGFFEGKR